MNKQRDIECWSCHADVLLSDRGDADGDCPRCGVELALDDYLIAALNKRDALAAECQRLREALEQAKEWLEGWASAEPYLSVINATLAGSKEIE